MQIPLPFSPFPCGFAANSQRSCRVRCAVLLAAAIGGCIGFEAGLIALAYTYMIAGLVAVGMLLARRWRHATPDADRGVPLAPCLAAGCGLALLGLPSAGFSLFATPWGGP